MSNSTVSAGPPQSSSASPVSVPSSPNGQSSRSPDPPPTQTPNTTPNAPSPSNESPTIVEVITTRASAPPGQSAEATTVTITSTSNRPSGQSTPSPSSVSSAAPSSTGAAALASSSASAAKSGSGLSSSGKITVAVVVPVAGVALIVLALLFFWRKRKQRKDAEELRRKEVEEYGFNPNNDPTLPAVGATASHGDEPYEMAEDGTAGYRGWGTTSNARKPSGTMSSSNGPIGMAVSDSGSQPGGYGPGGSTGSPTQQPTSEAHSGDPLLNSPNRPATAESEPVGALGTGPSAAANRDIRRGPSNASSSYSAANQSDGSGDAPIPAGAHGANYYNTDYDDGNFHQAGPYGEGAYSGGQPVIRDVQARRNTRIESPSVVPHQGNAGIAQNF
ncbi:MAG: hypothetical protein M1833_000307 [Piccolia ochrophora]|nr:MAG: hypothetical protein M1833_000307 [Piccolia ochrophora]